MANPTPNMALLKPTEGGSANVWDVLIDAMIDTIDLHDHTTGKGVVVPTAGIGINANLTFAGFAATNLSLAQLTELSVAPLSTHRSLYTKTDHNLYWLTNSGVEVQVTNGSTLNVSIVGGIGGDYSSVGALFSYDDATRRYLAQQEGSPRPWAGLATADIDLYEKAASITNKVTLKSPSALAASYSVTFPAAVPGSQTGIQVSTSGVLTFSNVYTGAVTATDFKNSGAMVRSVPACSMFAPPGGGGGTSTGGSGGVMAVTLGTANAYTIPLNLRTGDTITGVSAFVYKHSANTTTLTFKLCTLDTATGAETVQDTLTYAGNATGAHTVSAAESVAIASGTEAYLTANGAADALDLLYLVEVSYTRA